MKAGGKRELIVLTKLGYGDKEVSASEQPLISASLYWLFEIELVEVDKRMLTKFRMMSSKPSAITDQVLRKKVHKASQSLNDLCIKYISE